MTRRLLATRDPRVVLPAFKTVAKRLVEEAVVEKKFVVVALVVVELPVMVRSALIVEEALEMNPLLITLKF